MLRSITTHMWKQLSSSHVNARVIMYIYFARAVNTCECKYFHLSRSNFFIIVIISRSHNAQLMRNKYSFLSSNTHLFLRSSYDSTFSTNVAHWLVRKTFSEGFWTSHILKTFYNPHHTKKTVKDLLMLLQNSTSKALKWISYEHICHVNYKS